MFSDRNMSKLSSICGIPLRVVNMMHEMQNLSSEDKAIVEKYDRKFNFYDIISLYFMTIVMIANNLVLLFLIEDFNTTKAKNIVEADCYFLIAYGLIMLLVRIWNDKFYMLEPILNNWKAEKPKFAANKWLFFFSLIFVIGGIGTMTATVGSFGRHNYIAGIILTVITYVLFMFSSLFYRMHVGSYIKQVIDFKRNHQNVNLQQVHQNVNLQQVHQNVNV
jgi:hypothetical protein